MYLKKILHFFKKHYLVTLILLYVSIFLLWELIWYIPYIWRIRGFLVSCVIIIISKLFGYINILGFKKKNLLNGLKNGFPAIFAGLYSLLLSFIYINHIGFSKPNIFNAGFMVIWLFNTGLFEEIFMRGIILNILIRNSKKSKLLLIIISSIIFGISHFYNFLNGFDYLIGTISQVLYTIVIGIFLSIIYINYNNIWSIIIIHVLFNIMGIVPFALFSSVGEFLELHSSTKVVFLDIFVASIFLMYSIYLYKKTYEKKENGI